MIDQTMINALVTVAHLTFDRHSSRPLPSMPKSETTMLFVRSVACEVHGGLHFASCNDLVHQYECAHAPDWVVTTPRGSHLWDGSTVDILGVNEHRATRQARLHGHLPIGYRRRGGAAAMTPAGHAWSL